VPKSLAINKEQVAAYEARKAAAEAAGQRLEPGDLVRPEIRLEDCVAAFAQEELISDFHKGTAVKTTGFGTFPPYLLVQARKFEHAADWSPVKLDVSLQVPERLDLTTLRSSGLKPGEVELPDEDATNAATASEPAIALNENVIQSLLDMGFSREGARRAAYHTRDANDAEAAVNWCVAHMEDSDFNTPFEMPGSAAKKTAPVSSTPANKVYDEEKIGCIVPLGFTRAQAIKALEATGMNVERAVDWIFNHPDELMDTSTDTATTPATSASASAYNDGAGVYKLVGFISHMGTNANVGHYVAHLLKNGKWTIFNDENVALSENPPKDLAYLYLYQRV
jgi:ubiquitin carboxyl-terminal hydrolase 5/13